MIKGQIYKIPHTCFIAHWSTEFDSDYLIFGRAPQYNEVDMRFDKVVECTGERCIQLIERVRDHWVVDTWLECSEGFTEKRAKLRSHKYLKQILRDATEWSKK